MSVYLPCRVVLGRFLANLSLPLVLVVLVFVFVVLFCHHYFKQITFYTEENMLLYLPCRVVLGCFLANLREIEKALPCVPRVQCICQQIFVVFRADESEKKGIFQTNTFTSRILRVRTIVLKRLHAVKIPVIHV